jgi:hypothetical protein
VSRIFAGDRRVWRVAGATLAAFALGVVIALLVPRDPFLATNSIAVQSLVTTVREGDWLCVPDLDVPDGAGRVRFAAVWPPGPRPSFEARVRAGSRVVRGRLPSDDPEGKAEVSFPELRLDAETVRGEACIRALGQRVRFGGRKELLGRHPLPTVAGRPLRSEIAVWFLGPRGETRSLLSQLPKAFERAALFRPAPIGPWTYWVLVLLLAPLAALAGLRLLATRAQADAPAHRTAVAICAIGFAVAATWAFLTPPFDAPDEPEHYAYTQALAERGEPPAALTSSKLPTYSTELAAALDGLRMYARVQQPDERPPWLVSRERQVERMLEARGVEGDDGGGYLVSTSTHSPAYYSLSAIGHAIGSGGGILGKLTAMRLVSALLAALTAGLAFLTLRELVPSAPWAAVAAGLLVAFQPMFGFIGGAVNNDNGVNAAAALLIYLLIRGLRRGMSLPIGLGIGAMLVVAPLMKGTAYALVPAALVALLGMLWRRRALASLPGFAAVVVAFAVLQAIWDRIASGFERSVYTTPGGSAPTAGVRAVLEDPVAYANYLWQTFLPRLPFMDDVHSQRWPAYDIYVERGWAAFGWYAQQFPRFVYVTIVLTMMAAAALCCLAVIRHLPAARSRSWELITLLLVVGCVVGGVAAAYFTDVFRGVVAEQGRYAFTAIVPLAAIAVGACFAFGRRFAPLAGGVLVGAMAGLSYASQMLALTRFFS